MSLEMPFEISDSFLGSPFVRYACPNCGERLRSPLDDAGRADQCPACCKRITVPGADTCARILTVENSWTANQRRWLVLNRVSARVLVALVTVAGVTALALLVAAPMLAVAVTNRFELFGCVDPFRETVEDPGGEFTEYTNIPFPSSAKIIAVGDTHGGFHGDGEFYLVFDADIAEIASWLGQPPPWNQPEWLAGPVPYEIAGRCLADATWSESVKRHFEATTTKYVAVDSKQSSIPWHNGQLLAINMETGRVVLSRWDF